MAVGAYSRAPLRMGTYLLLLVAELERRHDPCVIGRPQTRRRTVVRIFPDNVHVDDIEIAAKEHQINPAAKARDGIEQIIGLTASKPATGSRYVSHVREASRDQVAVRRG